MLNDMLTRGIVGQYRLRKVVSLDRAAHSEVLPAVASISVACRTIDDVVHTLLMMLILVEAASRKLSSAVSLAAMGAGPGARGSL